MITRLALVCLTNTVTVPFRIPDLETINATSRVISEVPLPLVLTENVSQCAAIVFSFSAFQFFSIYLKNPLAMGRAGFHRGVGFAEIFDIERFENARVEFWEFRGIAAFCKR